MKIADVFAAVRARLSQMLSADEVQLTQNVDSDVMLGLQLQSQALLLNGTAQTLSNSPKQVFALEIQSGPQADGTTVNANNVFVGNNGVAANSSFVLTPGDRVVVGAADLHNVWVQGTGPDVVRILFKTG